VFVAVDPSRVTPVVSRPDLEPYLREEPPHIRFTPELRALSAQVIGSEKNPVMIARKLFAWMDGNIPWASAREYSTIPSLSEYAFMNRHGDCGIQVTLFITLLRMNGIPARWQSGWEFRPPSNSMHDWGMLYFEPYGWLPMDATYGLRKADNDAMKYFYVNGMDSYRLIFNDATGQPFYPVKIHPRSETIDSQRGEVEWRGGNLYFDKWDWDLEWKVLSE
jgi:transglutaminase-like putative cysteine protease